MPSNRLCSVLSCQNSSRATRDLDVKFHSIPTSPFYSKKWRDWIYIQNAPVVRNLKNYVLCAEHFPSYCGLPNGRLASGSVPSISSRLSGETSAPTVKVPAGHDGISLQEMLCSSEPILQCFRPSLATSIPAIKASNFQPESGSIIVPSFNGDVEDFSQEESAPCITSQGTEMQASPTEQGVFISPSGNTCESSPSFNPSNVETSADYNCTAPETFHTFPEKETERYAGDISPFNSSSPKRSKTFGEDSESHKSISLQEMLFSSNPIVKCRSSLAASIPANKANNCLSTSKSLSNTFPCFNGDVQDYSQEESAPCITSQGTEMQANPSPFGNACGSSLSSHIPEMETFKNCNCTALEISYTLPKTEAERYAGDISPCNSSSPKRSKTSVENSASYKNISLQEMLSSSKPIVQCQSSLAASIRANKANNCLLTSKSKMQGSSSKQENILSRSEKSCEFLPSSCKSPRFKRNCTSLKTPQAVTKTARRAKRYVGDLSPSDFSSPSNSEKYLTLIKNTVSRYKKKVKAEKKKTLRLQRKVKSLDSLVKKLRQELKLAEERAESSS